jgi:hypothetical protein
MQKRRIVGDELWMGMLVRHCGGCEEEEKAGDRDRSAGVREGSVSGSGALSRLIL